MQNRLQAPLQTFLLENACDYDLAVSLTLKQQDGPTPLSSIEAEKNLGHFLNRLNKKAFGNAASRHGRKIPVVPMLERTFSGRWHHHLALKNPFPDLDTCRSDIEECWSKTRWGYKEIQVDPIYDIEGWVRYITKSRNIDGWDIVNTHLVC